MTIPLPDRAHAFDFENSFYQSCDKGRFNRIIAHYELYKRVTGLAGAIVECGIFKGVSFIRFAIYRHLLEPEAERKLIGFDTFGSFPETGFQADQEERRKFIEEAGNQSLTRGQLVQILQDKGLEKEIELVEGNICKTIPDYATANPELKIALLNIDVDLYEPTVTILDCFYDRVVSGGVIILDDYTVFPGETKAIDDFIAGKGLKIEQFPFSKVPAFIIKP